LNKLFQLLLKYHLPPVKGLPFNLKEITRKGSAQPGDSRNKHGQN